MHFHWYRFLNLGSTYSSSFSNSKDKKKQRVSWTEIKVNYIDRNGYQSNILILYRKLESLLNS